MKKFLPEAIGALLCLLLGWLSGYSVAAKDSLWYTNLLQPKFSPPSWVFGPVWSILYIVMGIAFGKLWKNDDRYLLVLFGIQLVFNLIWSPLFFYYQRIDLALLDLGLLWISILIFILMARQQPIVVYLFLPYFFWVSFAFMLNYSLYKLNGSSSSDFG